MKKIIILALVCFVVFAGLSACDGREKLYILNWDEYLDEELIDKFELEYNCKVIYNIAESNEIMYSQLESEYAPYDIVFPSDYMIAQMHNKNEEENEMTLKNEESTLSFQDTNFNQETAPADTAANMDASDNPNTVSTNANPWDNPNRTAD